MLSGIFIAAELDTPTRRAVSGILQILRMREPLRLVRPEKLHITLLYIGDLQEAKLPLLKAAVSDVAGGMDAVSITAAQMSLFGRALVQRLDSDGKLEALAAALRQKADAAVIAYDRKKFHAHMTYCYNCKSAAERFVPYPKYHGKCGSISLLQSIRTEDGTVYKPLQTVKLA